MIGPPETCAPAAADPARARELLRRHLARLHRHVDRLFACLLLVQWLAGIAVAVWISPRTWAGLESGVHPHVWAATLLGGLIISLPVFMGLRHPSGVLTRHVIAAGQMLWSALLIHLMGGRIEAHFHVFGSLAFLAFYRDWRVLITASVVVAVDHAARGTWWPQSVFGVLAASPWRWIEHAAWVAFEDIFLAAACVGGVRELRQIAHRQAALEQTNTLIEARVADRTRALAESEARFRRAVTGSADGLWDWNIKAEEVYLAPRFKELLGFRDDEMESSFAAWEARLHPDDHAPTLEAISAHLANRAPYDIEYRLRNAADEYRWFRARGQAEWDDTDAPIRMAGSLTDIHDRKRAERELRRTQIVVDRTADAVFWVGDDAAILDVNDAACRLLGYDRDRLRQMSVLDINVTMNAEAWRAHWQELQQVGSVTRETAHRRRDGVDIPVLVTANHVVDDDHELICAFARDISDRKRDEEQVLQAKEVAEQANVAKSEFLAAMSHELRTPLNAIIGFTDGLLGRVDRHPLTDHQKSRLTRVKLAGHHLLSLINDILDIAKVEAGEMRLNVSRFDPGELAREVADLTEALVAEKRSVVSFSLALDRDLPTLESDREKIKQVLVNLLSNAVKFTDKGRVSLLVHRDGNHVQFSVEDTGIGIPANEVLRVFDKFHQVGGLHRQGGTGLGLALCQEFVDLLDSVLNVRSIEGEGSTFSLTVPIRRDDTVADDRAAASREIEERARQATPSAEQKVVLCIDDNPNNMLVLQDHLTEAGCHVVPLLESTEALAMAERYQPDLIVLDVLMPGLDGWEVLRRLKAHAVTQHIPVVLATAIENLDLGLSLGAEDYLVKPIDKNRLLESVGRMLDGSNRSGAVAVVDDDSAVRDVLEDLLDELDVETRSFDDGAPFLAALETWTPRLVLLDLMMPGTDGFEVIDRMRTEPAWRDIPIVVLTAAILSSDQLYELNRRVQLVLEKNGMSREATLQRIIDYVQALPAKGVAA